jgi:hypothetical protein
VEVPAAAPAGFNINDTSYVSPADLGSKVNATSTASPGGGGGGLPGWAKAVIPIGIILIVVLAAALAFVVLRRDPGHQRGFIGSITRSRPSGFSKFVDAQDAEAGGSKGGFGSGNVQMSNSGAANGHGYTSGDSLSHR